MTGLVYVLINITPFEYHLTNLYPETYSVKYYGSGWCKDFVKRSLNLWKTVLVLHTVAVPSALF